MVTSVGGEEIMAKEGGFGREEEGLGVLGLSDRDFAQHEIVRPPL